MVWKYKYIKNINFEFDPVLSGVPISGHCDITLYDDRVLRHNFSKKKNIDYIEGLIDDVEMKLNREIRRLKLKRIKLK